MFYLVNKNTNQIDLLETNILMVQEFKELINFVKNKKFPKIGWYYFRLLILINSTRSPYNKIGFDKEEKITKAVKNITQLMASEKIDIGYDKQVSIDLKIVKSPIFTAAEEAFRELDKDPIHDEFVAIENRYQQYTQELNNNEIRIDNSDDYKKLIAVGAELSKRYEDTKKILFEKQKSSDNNRTGTGTNIMQAIKQSNTR